MVKSLITERSESEIGTVSLCGVTADRLADRGRHGRFGADNILSVITTWETQFHWLGPFPGLRHGSIPSFAVLHTLYLLLPLGMKLLSVVFSGADQILLAYLLPVFHG
jgi:hypothetical protein